MKLKTNLHFHSKEDPEDTIPYTLQEGIDEAARLNFDVLATTLHNKYGYTDEVARYAADRGVLLIPGIEKTIQGCHVVLLNCNRDAESIASFQDLGKYRHIHPECFVLAVHPYYFIYSLNHRLEQYTNLFDGVEWSWYYSSWSCEANDKAASFARSHRLPFIATSDTHCLRYLNRSYAIIDTPTKDVSGVLAALKKGVFENVSHPSSLSDILVHQVCMSACDELGRMRRHFKVSI